MTGRKTKPRADEPTGIDCPGGPQDHYTILPNRMLRDPHLSWAAKGLLGHLLSYPPNQPVTFAQLAAMTGETEQTVRGLTAELADAGYLPQPSGERAEATR